MKNFRKIAVLCAPLFIFGALNASAVQVTFRVDMSEQTAISYFTPGTDTIEARGDFNGWSTGFALTNSVGSPDVYTGTYNVTNAVGSVLQYKFVKVIGGGDYWESDLTPATANNRTFSLGASGQVLPVVFFSDLPPASGVPTTGVTFQIDMSAQVTNGTFHPGSVDTVEARGTFNQSPGFWNTGFQLTNSPAHTNIYSGTWPDGNYPGTQEAWKFVIVSGFDNWEFIPNRPFTLQSGGTTLPVEFFNNQPGTQVPVTFQVDMTEPVLAGSFVPGNGDYVEVRGTFQQPGQWAGGSVLTNDPSAANTNLYTGTYLDLNAPGSVEEYKFVVDGGGGLGWEKPASTGWDNRKFTLGTNAQTLSGVYFSDIGPADVLSVDTMVTFTVNMTNAVGIDGVHFDPSTNNVYLNGDFAGWWNWSPFPPLPYQMTRNGTSLLYSLTVLIPAGQYLGLIYKYSIDGADDEAFFKVNHVRYIRGTGNFTLPVDVFGTSTVEPLVGALAISPSGANHVALSWNGRPGIHLQSATNINNAVWLDVPNTDGTNVIALPVGAGRQYYRLIKP